jgi:hypothetical protein
MMAQASDTCCDDEIYIDNLESKIQLYSTIDNATTVWLNTVHQIWSLCKLNLFK